MCQCRRLANNSPDQGTSAGTAMGRAVRAKMPRMRWRIATLEKRSSENALRLWVPDRLMPACFSGNYDVIHMV